MHPTHSHDCLPTLATGREADAILFTEGDELYAAMIDSIETAQLKISLESHYPRFFPQKTSRVLPCGGVLISSPTDTRPGAT